VNILSIAQKISLTTNRFNPVLLLCFCENQQTIGSYVKTSCPSKNLYPSKA
jgi:hypothetical protein